MSEVNQFMHSPKESHLEVVHRILQYLKSTLEKGIFFKRNEELSLEAYTNVDWARLMVDRRSTSCHYNLCAGNLVTWRSKKKVVVAIANAEAEFKTTTHEICELLWLQIVLEDLGVKWIRTMKLYCDDKFVINIAYNPIQHDHTKYVEIDRHFIKEKLDNGLICTSCLNN